MSPETKEALMLIAESSRDFINSRPVDRTHTTEFLRGAHHAHTGLISKIDSLLNPPPPNPVVEELSSLREYIKTQADPPGMMSDDLEGFNIALKIVTIEINNRIINHERSSSINSPPANS